MLKFKCYGDVNVLDHGSLFVAEDVDYPGDCFRLVKVLIDDDGVYRVWDTYIDLRDDWIDWAGIESSMDISRNESDRALLAREVFEYYGTSGTPVDEALFEDESGLRAELLLYGIEV